MKAKKTVPSAPAGNRRKRFRIARQGRTTGYSMQYQGDGREWLTAVRNLDLKQAQKQLERLKGLGCPIAEEIGTTA